MKSVFLYMRKKNLMGTNFGKYAGFTNLVKSVGGFIERNSDQLARFTGGSTGLLQCGGLLNFKLDVGRNPSFPDRYGYLDPSDPDAHGSISNNIVAETIIYGAYSESNFGYSILRFGVAGNEQIQDLNEIVITHQGFAGGAVTYVWDGANLNYRFTDQPLADYIKLLNGQRVSFDNNYIAVQATVDGTTALRRLVGAAHGDNEITISMWVWRNSGVNTSQKMYDIGDGITSGNDTTRFRHSPTGVLKSILSNVVTGTYTEVSSVTAGGASTEDTMHHLYMTAKNDLVDGAGTQVMELWEDGVLLGTDTTFFPTNSTTFNFADGDFVTLMARHDLAQFLTGRVTDIWSGGKYMDGVTYIASFRKPSAANVTWNGGIPVFLGETGVVSGITPSNYLGGSMTIADWNNGVNKGTQSDFTRIGNPIT